MFNKRNKIAYFNTKSTSFKNDCCLIENIFLYSYSKLYILRSKCLAIRVNI